MTTEKENQLSYAERLDIPQVTLAEAKQQIILSLESTQRRGCIVLVGESGLGKTQVFTQIKREMGYGLNPIHTAHYGLMGAGIPARAEGGYFDIAVPSVFPKKGEKSIVLFDELNRGLKHAIGMFFTMLEEGRMFNYTLPEKCLVVGTMNPDTGAYQVTPIEGEAAMRRRIKFLYVVPEFTGWYKHAQTPFFHESTTSPARDKPCHPSILAYFQANPKQMYDAKARDAGKQYLCPATIETISEDAYVLESKGISLYGDVARVKYSSSVGLTATNMLLEFIKDSTVVLGATDIVYKYSKRTQAAVKRLSEESLQEKLADLCENVLTLMFADKPDAKKAAKNFLNYCTDLPEEIRANMLFQMKETAKQANALAYLDALMGELQHYEDWIQIQLKLDSNHRKLDDKLRS